MGEERKQRRWRNTLEPLATVLVVSAAGVVLLLNVTASPAVDVDNEVRGVEAIDSLSVEVGRVLGSRRARSGVVVFSDFQCPFCRLFSEQTLPELRSD